MVRGSDNQVYIKLDESFKKKLLVLEATLQIEVITDKAGVFFIDS